MNIVKLMAATGAIVGVTGAAHAAGFGGAELSYSYLSVNSGSYTQGVLNGSVEMDFGSAFIAQLDIASWRYDGVDAGDNGAALHLGYAVSPDLTVGAFAGQDHWSDDWNFFGFEAKYMTGNWTAEAYAGQYNRDDGGSDANILGLDVDYSLGNNMTVFGAVHAVTNSGFDATFSRLGGRYHFTPALYLSANVDRTSYSGGGTSDAVGVELGYYFGGGTTFGARHYVNVLPGD